MICSRTPRSPVSAYWRNRASTRLTASSSPGRTSGTPGFDPIAWTMGGSDNIGRPRGLGGRVELSTSTPALRRPQQGRLPLGADREQPPGAVDALEGVGAAVLEHVVRPGDQ